jgi:hypothetical protein
MVWTWTAYEVSENLGSKFCFHTSTLYRYGVRYNHLKQMLKDIVVRGAAQAGSS